jgi:hypothetical protein
MNVKRAGIACASVAVMTLTATACSNDDGDEPGLEDPVESVVDDVGDTVESIVDDVTDDTGD